MKKAASEVFLSSVLGKPVINSRGQEIGRLSDLIMIPGERFPEVSHLVVQHHKEGHRVTWQRVTLFNSYVISILGPTQHLPAYHPKEGEILLKRDILDKQVVDVNGAKVVRVNDLKLGSHHNRLCLFFVDVGLRGLLRRMGYEQGAEKVAGLLGTQLPEQHIPWAFVQLLEGDPSRLTLTVAGKQLKELHPADLAGIISNIPSSNVTGVLKRVDPERAGEAIHELDADLRSRVISQLDSGHASQILREMAHDEAADVLGDLPEDKALELLGLMDEKEAGDIQELMEHEEDTAGALMDSEFIEIDVGLSVEQALERVRQRALEVQVINYLYVLDAAGGLEGVVSLRELLVHPAQTMVQDLMTRNLKFVQVDSTTQEVLEMVAKYNFVAVPVLDSERKMVGIVSVDDVLETIVPWGVHRRRHRPG